MLQLIQSVVGEPDFRLQVIALEVERLVLAKRRWRGVAADGTQFGFELETPLKDGATIWQTDLGRYVVRQRPEAVLQISLEVPPSAAAGIGWAIGNLHLELCAEKERLLALDDPAVRQLLDRLGVAYLATVAIFRAGHFARGEKASHELGPSHRH